MFKNSGEKRRKRLEEQKIRQRIIEEQREKEIKNRQKKNYSFEYKMKMIMMQNLNLVKYIQKNCLKI
ncbi:hypothetical protein GCWU000323_01416 [Leptotrichia hofstadii F0254]|uniref:Uncharacterized protein n=2 Tax=Leptotrichia hofstadii TaxID=157688 RepID=C9MXZ4_9FUSO|nr:hypothetical protein GCWU000323_01416 [Leptotrichia hofstadii F0254]